MMHSEEPAKTIIVLCATRPVPGIEKEMEARGIRVRWAPGITAATALLDLARNGIRCHHGTGALPTDEEFILYQAVDRVSDPPWDASPSLPRLPPRRVATKAGNRTSDCLY